MAGIHDDIDFYFSSAGDLALDSSGDIASTEGDMLLSFKQEVFNRIRSEFQDWALHPWIGAGLNEIIGEPNSRETAEVGKEKIINSLTIGAFVVADDVNIKYMPVTHDSIMYVIKIDVEPTEENGYVDIVQTSLLFDFDTHKITVY